MRLDAPDNAVKGEQIGIRVALFNYWEQDMEVCVRGGGEGYLEKLYRL